MKGSIYILCGVLLIALLFGCPTSGAGGDDDGILMVSCTNMAVGNGHRLAVVVLDGVNPVAWTNPATGIVVFGEATVDLMDAAMQPWEGEGGKQYTLLVAIDMDDDNVIGGDAGDYDVVPNPTVTINGDIAVTFDDTNFVQQ
ncbi:MAG: hypothetical protein P8107_11605 [Spirochaetia bacterium]